MTNSLEPRRIAAFPSTVLNLVVSGPSVNIKVASSLPGSMQEEAKEMKSDKDIVASQSTIASSTSTVRRSSVNDIENVAMENYNHIDRPPSPQCSTADFSARRSPFWGLENAAIDNYSHTNNPASAPPLRGGTSTPQSTTTDVQIEKDFAQLNIETSLGDTSAQVALGNMYSNGEGVSQDYQSAVDWYLRAANQGDPVALRRVGFLYYGDLGVS